MRYFPPNHPIFHRSVSGNGEVPTEGEKEDFSDGLPAWEELEMLFEGDRNTLTLLTGLFGGSLSYQDLAVQMNVDRSTAYRRVQRCLQQCRWVKAASLALACFQRREAFVIDTQKGVLVPVCSTDQFTVALPGRTQSFGCEPTPDNLHSFFRRHGRLLQSNASPWFFGGWVDDKYHLAVTTIFSSRTEASVGTARQEHGPGQASVQHRT